MEKSKKYREDFWNNSGNMKEEMRDFARMTEVVENEWTMGDEWFTLFCC